MSWLAIVAGIVLLVWGAERFIEGAAATARHTGAPALLIGMIVVGFGTSVPEMVVSAIAALDGNPDLALGNAYGSTIVNASLIVGTAALIAPIAVQSRVVRQELPLLLAIGLLAGALLLDGSLSRWDALVLLAGFVGLIVWSVTAAARNHTDRLALEVEQEMLTRSMSPRHALLWLVVGLVVLLAASRLLVWGAVRIAEALGVSDLVIGLTIVALGTSLPELAASVMAARKGEHEIAVGNIVGSNMFNLLAVVGIACAIEPIETVSREVLYRDWTSMMLLTVLLVFFGYGFRGEGRINRAEGATLLLAYVGYNAWLFSSL